MGIKGGGDEVLPGGILVTSPFGKKFLRVIIQAGRPGEYLGIPGPSQPLVPLGAVCVHIQEIPLLSPDDIVEEAVHPGAGT